MAHSVDISPAKLKQLAKKKGVKRITSLSAAEYRDLQLSSNVSNKSSQAFSFGYTVDFQKNVVTATLTGKHLSNNRISSLPFRAKLKYKTAIKEAMKAYWVQHTKELKSFTYSAFTYCIYVCFNSRSRDSEANASSIKIFQDTFTSLRLIFDDDIKHFQNISRGLSYEIVSKEYKIQAYMSDDKKALLEHVSIIHPHLFEK